MAGGGATAAIIAAIAQATKASGAIIHLEPHHFLTIMGKTPKPLIVATVSGMFRKNYQYLTPYKGLIFYTKSYTPLTVPGDAEIIQAKRIWVPDL
jgi:hypothetical protein